MKVPPVVRMGLCISIPVESDTRWVVPYDFEEGSASWKLRYTNWRPTKSERLQIAAMLDCYRELLCLSGRRRDHVIARMREQLEALVDGQEAKDG